MTKILMVCLGNICRSPLAEGIMRQKINEKGVSAIVDSAGTGAWHVGEPPDSRSVLIANQMGIDISGQRARKFTSVDFDNFDQIYVMDASNYNDVLIRARDKTDQEKVEMILNMSSPGSNKQVPDPYYGGDNGFRNVYNMLDEACEAIVNQL